MAYISQYSGEEIDNNLTLVSSIQSEMNNKNILFQQQIDDIKNSLTSTILNTIYPIGSLYTSFNSANPSSIIGGTWTQIKDCFLMAAGSTYAIDTSGGSSTHTHDYGLQYGAYYRSVSLENNTNAGALVYDADNNITVSPGISSESYTAPINNNAASTTKETSMTHQRTIGNTSYTSNLPPYQTIYMWKRTA